MSGRASLPLSRPVPLHRVTPDGIEIAVEASEAERAAVAADLGLPALHALRGTFRLVGTARRVHVTGRVTATVEQVCVVSLDPFAAELDEPVDVTFEEPASGLGTARSAAEEMEADLDRPDELVGDRIDLGALTVEFLSLGLDPHPRKPGVAFVPPADDEASETPFAGLAALRPGTAE